MGSDQRKLVLQERTLGSAPQGAALRSAADRVHVLGRVHERLQRANHQTVVDMGEFLSALCDDLRSALKLGRRLSTSEFLNNGREALAVERAQSRERRGGSEGNSGGQVGDVTGLDDVDDRRV